MKNLRSSAWILILIVEVGCAAWGAGAALSPDHLLGSGGKAILPAGFEGYTGASWSELVGTSPLIAEYLKLLFRMYGIYNVLFGVLATAIAVTAFRRGERWAWWTLLVGNSVALLSAITYDKLANAIGPFEMTEYLGLVMVWAALAVTAPFRARAPSLRPAG